MSMEINNIYYMDCLDGLRQMGDASVDLLVTDPPYLMRNIQDHKESELGARAVRYQGVLKEQKLTEGYDARILDEICRVMKTINLYIWCNVLQIPMYVRYFVLERGCRMDILIWHKTNPMPLYHNKWLTDKEYCLYFRKGGYCSPSGYAEAKTVWDMPLNTKDKGRYGHPAIKPLPIMENIIRNSSREGDIVLDPFIGSGTTAVAALRNNRQFIGFENNKDHYDIAIGRIAEERAAGTYAHCTGGREECGEGTYQALVSEGRQVL